jgi:hypothetical protein
VVQAIVIAILATVLLSTLSPQTAALQQQFQNAPVVVGAAPIALCAPAAGAGPGGAAQMMQQACRENIAGFERAYKVTFYASIAALLMGLLLPGWPFKWAGRRAADEP